MSQREVVGLFAFSAFVYIGQGGIDRPVFFSPSIGAATSRSRALGVI